MKIITISRLAAQMQVTSNVQSVPRVGDSIDIFYEPHPVVKKVIWFPSTATLKSIEKTEYQSGDITALVLVD